MEPLELTVSQARVLGALLEKELVTPDAYPLTLKALATACNQTTDRDPVIHFEIQQVESAALALKSKGLLRVVYPGAGERATRYRQVLDEVFELLVEERVVLCLLLLRGAQTLAELKARAERMHRFADLAAVEAVLGRLIARDEPLVQRIEPGAGQKVLRWIQLLEMGAAERATPARPAQAAGHSASESGLAALERRLAALEILVEQLIEALGDLVQLERAEPDS
jgi:uncharacterized protein YceH (UPF0502 family)